MSLLSPTSEHYFNSHKDCINNEKRIVRFCDIVIKYDHMSREEMIAQDVFWTKDDFGVFHNQALYEMKMCKMKYQCVSIRQIMNLLYLSNVCRPPRIDGQIDHPGHDIMEEVVRDIEIEATNRRNNAKVDAKPIISQTISTCTSVINTNVSSSSIATIATRTVLYL